MEEAVEHTSSAPHYQVVLLGKTGAGKSATANTILGRKAFISKKSFKAVTRQVQYESLNKNGVNLTVYDTPGFFDPEACKMSSEELLGDYAGLPKFDTEDPLVYLLVIKCDRFTAEEKSTVEMIEYYLPDWLKKNTWIIFTRGDELERDNLTIEEFIEEAEDLKEFVQKFDNRYFVFNNFAEYPEQVDNLIEKIKEIKPERRMETDTFLERQVTIENNSNERRFFLLGKTGVGKSATGNTILGKNAFKSERSLKSVTKQSECQKSHVAGREVSIIDTPGFFDPNVRPTEIELEIAKSFKLCDGGPHAFLYVVSLSERFTKADEAVIKNIEKLYGKGVSKYTIPVFTHSDQLEGKSVEELIKQNITLERFVQRCGGRYHVMNNKDMRNRKQVNDLLDKIDKIVNKNGGSCYSNQMFYDGKFLKFNDFLSKYKHVFYCIALVFLIVAIVVGNLFTLWALHPHVAACGLAIGVPLVKAFGVGLQPSWI